MPMRQWAEVEALLRESEAQAIAMKRLLALVLLGCGGCAVRPCPLCGYPALRCGDVLEHFVPNLGDGPCTWKAKKGAM